MRRNPDKRFRSFRRLSLICFTAGSLSIAVSPMSVLAAGPSSTEEELAEDAEAKAKLDDNQIDFDEIGDRIENYNTSYLNTKSELISSSLNLGAAKILSEEAADLMDTALDFDNETDEELYESYKAMARAVRKESEDYYNDELSTSNKRTLAQAKKNLVKIAEDQMIEYQSTAAGLEAAKKETELAEAELSAAKTKQSSGLASEEDVLEAQKSYMSAQESEQELSDSIDRLARNIKVLLGYDTDADVTISDVGDPNLSAIDEMDPETDKTEAIQSNYSLQSTKQQSVSGATDHKEKLRTVETTEETIASDLEQLYQEVLSDKEAYQAAQTSLQAAENNKASADRKNEMGMMSRIDYLEAEVSYENAKASEEQAAMTLRQAINDYQWAVKGNM